MVSGFHKRKGLVGSEARFRMDGRQPLPYFAIISGRPVAEVTIDSIRPVVGRVPGGDSVGRAAGGRSSSKLRLEIQRRMWKRETNLPVNIPQIRK
jgi:hypothetical protein